MVCLISDYKSGWGGFSDAKNLMSVWNQLSCLHKIFFVLPVKKKHMKII